MSDIVRWISTGPSISVIKFQSYTVNGTQFNTRDRDANRNTQNFVVLVSLQKLYKSLVQEIKIQLSVSLYFTKLFMKFGNWIISLLEYLFFFVIG